MRKRRFQSALVLLFFLLIIAEEVRLEGMVRTLGVANREKIQRLIENFAKGITQPFGASFPFTYKKGAPPVYNHPQLAGIMHPTKDTAPLHSPYFNPDERSIPLGIKLMCHLLLDCLGHQNRLESPVS